VNAKSLKEKAVLATLGMVLLYALAAGLWFMSQQAAWKKAARTYARAKERYQKECALIREKAMWTEAYENEKARMPMFESGKATDTTWLSMMDALATKHHISVAQRQGGKETEAGDVMELEVDVKNWEGALESLVKFMYELENPDETDERIKGMFDIKTLNFRPSPKKGYLKGSFTLTCAYMREK
jgi:hypothetical protein